MAEQLKKNQKPGGPGGPRGMRGPRPKVENPGKGQLMLEKERERSKAYFDMVFQEAERLGLCE